MLEVKKKESQASESHSREVLQEAVDPSNLLKDWR